MAANSTPKEYKIGLKSILRLAYALLYLLREYPLGSNQMAFSLILLPVIPKSQHPNISIQI